VATTGELIGLLCASYPSASIPAETVKAYARLLSDLDPAELEPVVLHQVATSRFFPTVAELRQAVSERRLALPTREDAWARVSASKDDVPIGELTEPERAALEHVGGRFGIRSSEEPSILRAQFLKAYDAERRRAVEVENVTAIAPPGERRAIAARTGD
jgi:hypothetical protein